MTVLYRIVMNVIYVTLIGTFITDNMFPKASLPNAVVLPSANAVLTLFPLWEFVRQIVL